MPIYLTQPKIYTIEIPFITNFWMLHSPDDSRHQEKKCQIWAASRENLSSRFLTMSDTNRPADLHFCFHMQQSGFLIMWLIWSKDHTKTTCITFLYTWNICKVLGHSMKNYEGLHKLHPSFHIKAFYAKIGQFPILKKW